jgi:lipoprotein-anchoring transpeptidase ErfK/SrfK
MRTDWCWCQGFRDEGFSDEGFSDEGFSDEGFRDEGFGDEGFEDEGFGYEALGNTRFRLVPALSFQHKSGALYGTYGELALRVGALSAVAISAVFIGVGAFIGQAAAQYYPPGTSGGYRPAPMPEYDDDDADGPPNIFSRPPGGVPNSPGSAQSYHYGPPQPYDPRYGADPDAIPAPRYGSAPNYNRAPVSGAYNARPDDGADSMRPPGALDQGRPSADVGANRSPVDLNPNASTAVASLPPEDQPEVGESKELPENFRRQLVDYQSAEPAGTLIIDTPHTYLYLVMGNGKAIRYGIGVGREGFTWTGRERISRMAEWPDWIPPKEMIERQPYLPRFMAGGESNPLGARALYLGNSLYRIHGTNQPSTIGSYVSSGCIRLTNADIEDLYRRVQVGTRVVVLPGSSPTSASVATPAH